MKHDTVPPTAAPATLQDVSDRLAGNPDLSDIRKRDLRSAVRTYGRLVERPLSAIPVDLADIRGTLDPMAPAQAKVSRKRWANLRSDLVAAIAAAGLRPMLNTARLKPDASWAELLSAVADRAIRNGLSRLARWASSRQLPPKAIDAAAVQRFVAELEVGTLVRNIPLLHRKVSKIWNRLAALLPDRGLQVVALPSRRAASDRVPWRDLPASFRQEAENYLRWCSVPDPLEDNARTRALAPATVRLRRDYIHLAANAACAAGIDPSRLTSLACLVEPETFRAILRHQWDKRGGKATPYLRDLATGLIVIASEWIKVPPDQLAALKKLRGKLGSSPAGLTEKNKAMLRRFDDPRVMADLIRLPDTLWRSARRNMATSKRWFIDLQTALAIDILLHAPMRIENLVALRFDEHIHWPQGRRKPALLVIRLDETKNDVALEFELPTVLADRLYTYRNEIAPAVIGRRPDAMFVTLQGKPRGSATISIAIQRTVFRHIGVKITTHQFRHLAAKIHLDANPGAYELVRQLLGHRTLRTTTRFYAGVDTRRAGRAHAELISRLRQPRFKRLPRRRRDEEE